MTAENVYIIFEALTVNEKDRFVQILNKHLKTLNSKSRTKEKDKQLEQYCNRIVNDYLHKLRIRCLQELDNYKKEK